MATGPLPKQWSETKMFFPPVNTGQFSDKHCASFLQSVVRTVSLVDSCWTTNTGKKMTFSHRQDTSFSFMSASLMSMLSSLVVSDIYYWIIFDSYGALWPAQWVIPRRIVIPTGLEERYRTSKDEKPQQGISSISVFTGNFAGMTIAESITGIEWPLNNSSKCMSWYHYAISLGGKMVNPRLKANVTEADKCNEPILIFQFKWV